MSENNNLKVQLPDSIDNAIKNATDKPSQSIGELFNDIYTMIFGEFHAKAEIKRIRLAAGVEKFKEELDEEIKKIPSEKVIDPNFRLISSALQTSKYTVEEESLRSMFTRLIANSMNSDYTNYVHPSYVSIIKDMSSLDAENLVLFKDNEILPIVNYIIKFRNNLFYIVSPNVFLSNPNNHNIEQQSQSISSLKRLGLISTDFKNATTKESYYIFKQTNEYKLIEKMIYKYNNSKDSNEFYKLAELCGISGDFDLLNKAKLKVVNGVARTTSLGENFIKVCT